MVWLVRILIFAILATTGVVPLPWGHSHQGMQGSELNRHCARFHLADAADEMPQGWHWHFYAGQQHQSLAVLRDSDRFMGMGTQLVDESVNLTTSTFATAFNSGSWKLEVSPRAVIGPKIYLRFLVLRN